MPNHRAIAITSPGTIDQITLPTPTPVGNEVLIEVQYTALIPFDTYQIDKNFFVQGYPTVLGFASSGRVKAVGPDVTDLKEGDKVRLLQKHANQINALTNRHSYLTKGGRVQLPCYTEQGFAGIHACPTAPRSQG